MKKVFKTIDQLIEETLEGEDDETSNDQEA